MPVRRYWQIIWSNWNALGAELSLSSELAAVSTAVRQLADQSGDVNRARADEPYRRAITGMYARLAATYERLTGKPPQRISSVAAERYESAEAFAADLRALEDSLHGASNVRLTSGGSLPRLIRAVQTFGFHLATLDLRQNSDVHERVIAVTACGGRSRA